MSAHAAGCVAECTTFTPRPAIAGGLCAMVMLTAGCGVLVRKPLDPQRPIRVAAGVGSATLSPGAPPLEELPAEELRLTRAVNVYGRLARRLAGSEHLALSASLVGQVVTNGELKGDGIAGSCGLSWLTIGPALGIDVPMNFPLWVSGDIGVSVAHTSRSACPSIATSPANATTLTPTFDLSLDFGLTSRVGWGIGGSWNRLPLDRLGLTTNPRYVGSGAVFVVVAF